MSIFLILPLLLFGAYFLAALNIEAAESILPHCFEENEQGILCRIFEKPDTKSGILLKKEKITVYDPATEQLNLKKEYFISSDEISHIHEEGLFKIIFLKGRFGRFIVVPIYFPKKDVTEITSV